jgi:hypothetical protein
MKQMEVHWTSICFIIKQKKFMLKINFQGRSNQHLHFLKLMKNYKFEE